MYQFESKVRYSETTQDGTLSLLAIVNYLQDCCLFHSESKGAGVAWMETRDRAWVLSAWQIFIYKRPRFLEKIRVETRPYGFQSSLGYRSFDIVNEQGERAIEANSIWCYIQPSLARPARITQEDMDPYLPADEPRAWIGSRKIERKAGIRKEPILVRREHLDTNSHVNNGQYINIAADYLPDDFEICTIKTEYKSQARLGDVMIPEVSIGEHEVVVVLGDGEKTIYAIVAFLDYHPQQ